MKHLVLTDDILLFQAFTHICDNPTWIKSNEIGFYLRCMSFDEMIVFVDDRIANVNVLAISTYFRSKDKLIRISFSERAITNVPFMHTIISRQLLSNFFSSVKNIDVFTNDKLETPSDYLTYREAQVISLIMEGKSIYSISSILQINPKTTYRFRSNIITKFGCKNYIDFCKKVTLGV